ncbi:AI-2E family transporter [Pseudactinotalea sp. HY158]|uniref:AI-2E family transporter n=1 Tax=Pseudactinotalea sp. HY158 TaxID=2654547 RepID=UPI00129C3C36|nr:AI-2E family transporter [Pseudactinotalea sp. HY158]QGH68713.1 AI-2E family transporter [Pseudactinotalea sp. HY158]
MTSPPDGNPQRADDDLTARSRTVTTRIEPEPEDPVGEVPPESLVTDVELRPDPPRAAGPVPRAVRASASWSWRFIVIVAAAALLVYFAVQLKTVVVPVMVAALVAALLLPVVRFLSDRLRFPQALASLTAMVAALAVAGGLITLAGASIATGMGQLGAKAFDGFHEALRWLSEGPLGLDEDQINAWVDQLGSQLSSNADKILSGALSVTSSVGHVAAGALIALFCLFFFLKDGRGIWMWVVGLFPRNARERVDGAALRSWGSLASYTRTQIMVAFVDALGIGIGAAILGVPLALPLAVLVFLGSFIPIVGAILTGAIAVLVALVDQGFGTALVMLAIVLGVQQAESNLLQPMLMSRALSLHPVGVLLAVATGTLVGGIVGALFAVPIVAVVNTALNYLHGRDPLPPSRREVVAEMTRRWRVTRGSA